MAALCTVVLLAGLLAILMVLVREPVAADIAALNDLRARMIAIWPEEGAPKAGTIAAALPEDATETVVFDDSGAIIYGTMSGPDSALAAAQENAQVLGLYRDGEHLGLVVVPSSVLAGMRAAQAEARIVVLGVFGALAVTLILVLWRIWRRVLAPFHRLRSFARDVAGGDFDSPLPMDRGNAFGAFSESFDLMRAELRAARLAEAKAREENRELLAELGHDIRTPVAVIQAAAEVLELDEEDPTRRERLATIRGRSEQVSSLITELIRMNAENAVALSVSAEPHSPAELAALIRSCDAEEALGDLALPECLVDYDSQRLRQIIDNLLANAAKYAGTAVEFIADIVALEGSASFLRMRFRDFGPGVPERELGTILTRGGRGSNSAEVPGSGLGLFAAAQLLERMGGELTVQNAESPSGFIAVVLLPLSGRGAEGIRRGSFRVS